MTEFVTFPALVTYGLGFVDLAVLAWASTKLPWRILVRERGVQHLLLGSTVVLMFMWSLRAGLSAGLAIHFLGMTTMTLLFGWDLALCAGVVALAGTTLVGREFWPMFPVNSFCYVILPVAISHSVLRVVEWKLPKNFFIYLLLCAFIGGGIAAVAGGLAMAGLLGLAGIYPWSKIVDEYVTYLPLILFPEGLLNGIIMTGMMVYYPDWIRTFDPRRYLDGK